MFAPKHKMNVFILIFVRFQNKYVAILLCSIVVFSVWDSTFVFHYINHQLPNDDEMRMTIEKTKLVEITYRYSINILSMHLVVDACLCLT